MNTRKLILVTALLTTVYAQSTMAQGDQRGGRRGPPPEAINACSGKSAGAACSFNGRNDEQLRGTCFSPQDNDLACKPDGHDERGGQRSQ